MDDLGPRWTRLTCPALDYDRHGHAVGRCWFTLVDGWCPVHGDVTDILEQVAEDAAWRRTRPQRGEN